MGTVYRREGTRFLWLKWYDREGEEQYRSSGTEDEAESREILDEIERQERGVAEPAAPGMLTVDRWFEETWLKQREIEQPSAWKTDASRLRHHFLPYFG